MKETEITIKVKLDSNNIPEEIYWSAPDGGMKDEQSKAILLSFWDSAKKETLKMDLWTKEMPIDEMKFALHFNYNENLNTGINIVKNINGFDVKFNIDADLTNKNQNSNILINKSF